MHIEPKMKTRFLNEEHYVDLSMTRSEWDDFLDKVFERVPDEYKDTAVACAYSSHDQEVFLSASYKSPETNEEMEGARQRQMFIEAQEKEQLRKLMEKYPDGR